MSLPTCPENCELRSLLPSKPSSKVLTSFRILWGRVSLSRARSTVTIDVRSEMLQEIIRFTVESYVDAYLYWVIPLLPGELVPQPLCIDVSQNKII